ncbi:MAG: glucokinase [Verrucomicrobiota bacterium]|nr:glucokinase [Verrucomicrobiota bacterium]
MILVGDIGGTYTRLALFEGDRKIEERKYFSRRYESLDALLLEFQQQRGVRIGKACFGVAGSVHQGVCKATNLPWKIDALQLGKVLQNARVEILNDLEAKAYGIDCLSEEDLFPLQTGRRQEGNRALIAAGTGLGEAGLVWDGTRFLPFACEGGHADFAARDEEEWALFLYLKKRLEHVSYEQVVSGPGLYHIFQFLTESGRAVLSPSVQKELEANDPPRVISEWGMSGKDPACARAFGWFLSLYGAEAGNLALKFLAINGLYIAGGMAPVIKERMKEGEFLPSFAGKGRFRSFLESIPVWVVLNDDVALLGAAEYLRKKI